MRSRTVVALCVVAWGSCKKHEESRDRDVEPPPPTRDWKVELADVIPNSFEELCALREEAPADVRPAIDEVARRWKQASLDRLKANLVSATTHPRLAAILQGLYATPSPCDRPTLWVTATQQVEKSATVDTHGTDIPVLISPASLAASFAVFVGSYVIVRDTAPTSPAHVRLDVVVDGDPAQSVEVAGLRLPLLRARGTLVVTSVAKDGPAAHDDIEIPTITADANQIQFLERHRPAGADRSAAIAPAIKTQTASLGYQVARAVDTLLGLKPAVVEAIEPFEGRWSLVGEPDGPHGDAACRKLATDHGIDTHPVPSYPVMIDARLGRLVLASESFEVGVEGNQLIGHRRLHPVAGSSCQGKRDRADVVFDREQLVATFTIVDGGSKPCVVCTLRTTYKLVPAEVAPGTEAPAD